ncbi:hypothetical protein BSG1_09281 [Bacillus sp. SG-1]|nr:hypothetical protein BSG1_09281 [Bacillus sp. SG-1]
MWERLINFYPLPRGAHALGQINILHKKAPALKISAGAFGNALGGNRTPILRTGILRAIRCTTRASCTTSVRYPIIIQKPVKCNRFSGTEFGFQEDKDYRLIGNRNLFRYWPYSD